MTTTEMTSPWMTVKQAAAYLGMHPNTVLHHLKDTKQLRGYQPSGKDGVWRIHRSDVDEFIRTPPPRRRRPHTRNLRSTR
ncbi:helix-turn-helix domain-containing protein (plasmid) [Rhodococcus sp. DMF-1]|uniref:helix-turn-helix domain-containing protein n=1 Tax=Rhodococcus TaxID=1827 RepID=UPI000A62E757|nr:MULTISPECIES: helix-turn-helix domain-containing protein [Rhodococcus]UIR36913.1 helix-turn-helix domain-containing protein [Rhodococcus sp. DMF-1]UIR39741.1 helix-turn-helix domain-containing protein [Rhodococcus sp. DMF-1]